MPRTSARAEEPLKIIVGFPAGSGVDVLTRLIAEQIRIDTGTAIIVDNRAGGGGRIAAEYVAKAEPDGRTILAAPIVTTAFTPFVYKKLNFDPMKDLAPITRLGNFQFALATNNAVPAKSVEEFHFVGPRQSGQGQLRLALGRDAFAFPRRDVQPRHRHRHAAYSLQGLRRR